jgi:hypothetical protein
LASCALRVDERLHIRPLADDVPTCPVEIRAGGEIWIKPVFGSADPVEHWRERLDAGLGHNLSLVVAKAVHGQLAAGLTPSDVVRQTALFGTHNRDGWDSGMTILTPDNRTRRR